jgi:hypothetical protein
MIAPVALATALAAVGASTGAPAFAQVDLRTLRQQSEIQQQQDIARQNALAAQREISAAQSRYDTQLTLRSLNEAVRTPPVEPTLRPTVAPPPRGPSADDMVADAARMEQMTDARLAESNARLRDIAPAR